MLRKLPLAMAIALAVMPLQSQALGLGKIKTNSVLNQPFEAEIQLLSVPPGELDGVKVELASSEAFNRAGVERPFMLSRLQFKTYRKPNGNAVIQVSSNQSIQEPFLNFLIEVDWPKGRMVREFTVLLDPPLTTGRKAAPVAAPKTSMAPQSQVMSSGGQAMQPQRMPAVASDGKYGPVQQNETLWSISDRYRPAGVSVHQMMIAILENNPQAFASNNINTLKAGSILRIPAREDVQISNQAAVQMANEQYRDWKQGLSEPVEEAVAEDAEKTPLQSEPQVSEEKPVATEKEAAEESARLKLSGSEVASEIGTGEDTDVGGIKQELLTTQEKLVTAESEAEELRTVMTDLEQQLVDMKRLLELKDDQLSKLQAANDGVIDTLPTEEMAVAEEPAGELAPVEEAVSETVTEVEEAAVSAEPEPAPEPVVESPASPDVQAEQPKKEEGILDLITGSATMMGIAVAVLVVLLALIWSVFSRRKETKEAADETVSAAPAEAVAVDADTQPVAEEHPEDETSFLSEFTPADLDSLQDQETGEVDPISEADVYIAYGRFDQAEDLVKQALEAEPGKIPYQHKLLEIYYANKDKDKFTELAAEMHENGAESLDPDAWNRAKLMGIDLDPDNDMFADAMDVASMDMGDDLDMALSELESQLKDDVDSSLADLNESSEQLEDLDLDEMAGKLEAEAAAGGDSMTLDLDALNAEATAEEEIMPLPDVDLDASASTVEDEDARIDELAAELESFNLDAVDASDAAIQSPQGEDLTGTADAMLPDTDSLEDLSAELDEIDDVTTKLDLARAYIEMGDKEGAKGILEEVVEEGSDAQKQEAQTLISDMG